MLRITKSTFGQWICHGLTEARSEIWQMQNGHAMVISGYYISGHLRVVFVFKSCCLYDDPSLLHLYF